MWCDRHVPSERANRGGAVTKTARKLGKSIAIFRAGKEEYSKSATSITTVPPGCVDCPICPRCPVSRPKTLSVASPRLLLSVLLTAIGGVVFTSGKWSELHIARWRGVESGGVRARHCQVLALPQSHSHEGATLRCQITPGVPTPRLQGVCGCSCTWKQAAQCTCVKMWVAVDCCVGVATRSPRPPVEHGLATDFHMYT